MKDKFSGKTYDRRSKYKKEGASKEKKKNQGCQETIRVK